MVGAELLIGDLRNQTRELQSLLNYLESCEMVGHEEYAYLHVQLRWVIGRLRKMDQLSSKRGVQFYLPARWLN